MQYSPVLHGNACNKIYVNAVYVNWKEKKIPEIFFGIQSSIWNGTEDPLNTSQELDPWQRSEDVTPPSERENKLESAEAYR